MKRTFGLIFWFVLLFMALVSCLGDTGGQVEGTSWELDSLDRRPALPDGAPTLVFEDGRVVGNASCNNFGGDYKVSGSRIEIGEIESTLMACVDNALMDQEQDYLGLLFEVSHIEISDGKLILTTEHGENLVFVPTK